MHRLLEDLLATAGLPAATGQFKHAGVDYFSKCAAAPTVRAEAACLAAMGSTAPPGLVPRIVAYGEGGDDGPAALVTTYAAGRGDMARLGRELAAMHSAPESASESASAVPAEHYAYTGQYGFPVPTFCGATEQDNTWTDSWEVFFRDRRLGDLVARIGEAQVDELWGRMKEKTIPLLLSDLSPAPVPVPLHGDLWPGNVAGIAGQAVIFDPAGCYGHGEADLGMTRMFGGFPPEFYEAYHAVHPRSEPSYDQRIRLYELYHHLNHALMFGGSYLSSSLRIMRELVDWAEGVEGAGGSAA